MVERLVLHRLALATHNLAPVLLIAKELGITARQLAEAALKVSTLSHLRLTAEMPAPLRRAPATQSLAISTAKVLGVSAHVPVAEALKTTL